jgi:Fur family peroxide stress response transcriptional regulator
MRGNSEMDTTIIRALRGNGYKATPQRIAAGRFILMSKDHPTAQAIYIEVKKSYPTVSLSTVYKTIKILKEVGLIQELNFSKDQARFDSYMEPHINLVCMKCGAIIDAKNSGIQDIMTLVSAEENFVAKGHRFEIYGICQSCRIEPFGNQEKTEV